MASVAYKQRTRTQSAGDCVGDAEGEEDVVAVVGEADGVEEAAAAGVVVDRVAVGVDCTTVEAADSGADLAAWRGV